jgi:hypothetical protein
MQSLFIVSLPRTFSTQVFHVARRALSLQQPLWVMDGEILNVDRYWHYQGARFDESAKYTTAAQNPPLFAQLHDFLDQITVPENFIYKDVTQPFVLAAWRGLQNFRVLKIQRAVTDVAYAMLSRGWFYPNFAAAQPRRVPRLLALARRVTPYGYGQFVHAPYRGYFTATVVEGLLRAEAVLQTIPGVTLLYDDIVRDEEVLHDALRGLYPDAALAPVHYMDSQFIAKRELLAKRRTTRAYQNLYARVEPMRAQLGLTRDVGA